MTTRIRYQATGEEKQVEFDELKKMIASQQVGPLDEINDEIVTWGKWIVANNLNVFHKNSPVEHPKGELILQREAEKLENERRRKLAEEERRIELERYRTFTADMLQETFPAGIEVPGPLRAICEYRTQIGLQISGHFRLWLYEKGELVNWFRLKPDSAKSFLPFGRGVCGDIYAIWLTDDLSAEDAPVVVFGSEGELPVIALNIREFCSLLCLGYSDAAFDDVSIPPTRLRLKENNSYDDGIYEVDLADGSAFAQVKPFREYMLARYDLSIPSTGEPIHKAARERFPHFQQWVHDNGHED